MPVNWSTSANTTFAPVNSAACAVAVWVWAGTITSSPFFKPIAIQAKCKPEVQLETVVENFDLVNSEKKVVGDVKHYKTTSGGNRPSAKFSTLNEYVWLMQLLEQSDGSEWKKLFVIGEDLEMVKQYIKEFEKWLGDIEFYYYSEETGIKKIR